MNTAKESPVVGKQSGSAKEHPSSKASPEVEHRSNRPHYRVIDAHLHMFNTKLDLPAHFVGVQRENATVEKTLAAMDRGGVEKAFLISYTSIDIARDLPPHVDPTLALPLYSKEYMVDAWKAHKDLFYCFTDHIDPSREGYLDDLQRDLEAGADGVKLLPAFHGFLPDHPGFLPVYELCRSHNKPIIIDGSFWYMVRHMPPHRESLARQGAARTLAGYLATLVEVFRSFPSVAFSMAHAGTASKMSDYDEIYQVLADHPNAYCDTAAVTGYIGEYNGYNATWVEDLNRAVGAGKIMYGTDWPYWDVGLDGYLKGSRRWTVIADECPNLTEAEKRMILAENADRFVKNLLPITAANPAPYAERARQLHRDSVVIVTHDHNPITSDVPKMQAGGVTGKCYQLFLDVEPGADFQLTGARREGWAAQALSAMEEAESAIKADPERILLALTAEDFLRAKQEGKIAILFGTEGGKLLEGKLEWLDKFHRRGLRELQLTWAVPNQIVERSGKTGEGLTAFGKEVVQRCNQLGVIVCLTHLPAKAFHEAVAISSKPPILSHDAFSRGGLSGVGAPELKALASRRGLMGIHFYSTYLGSAPCPARVVDQIDRVADLVGIDTVALGCDFFPTNGPWADLQRAQAALDQDIVWAVRGISQISQVTEEMLARHYSDEDIRKVLGGNFLRVCREVFGK